MSLGDQVGLYDNGTIDLFLRKHFLHWLEALSLMKSMSIGVSVIEEAPLQVYTSSLVFSPAMSRIRELFRDEEPSWVEISPKVDDHWSPLLQTLEGHTGSVQSVVYSPDGQQLASASVDKTIRTWDAETGALQQVLKSHAGY
jgi:WD40 repeat protein